MDGFVLKKILSLLVQLIPAIPLLMLLVCLVFYRQGRKLLMLGCLLLLAASSPVVSNIVVNTLEKQYSVLAEAPRDTTAILVLAAGHFPVDRRPPNSVLSTMSLSRLMEAVRLWKSQPDALLLTTAGPVLIGQSHAEAMAAMAMAQGVPESKIRLLPAARDTEDEITLAVALLKELEVSERSRLLVVSSATHLPRAAKILEPLGLEHVLAPTDFIAMSGDWYRFSARHLFNTERAVHEYFGMLWLSIRHWFVRTE